MASPPAQLRTYRSSDFETLYRIDQICFPRGIAYERFELKVYLQLEGSYCLVAEVGGDIAGFILTELAEEQGHIITLDVLKAYRRRGIGSLLLAALGDRTRPTILIFTQERLHVFLNSCGRPYYCVKEGSD